MNTTKTTINENAVIIKLNSNKTIQENYGINAQINSNHINIFIGKKGDQEADTEMNKNINTICDLIGIELNKQNKLEVEPKYRPDFKENNWEVYLPQINMPINYNEKNKLSASTLVPAQIHVGDVHIYFVENDKVAQDKNIAKICHAVHKNLSYFKMNSYGNLSYLRRLKNNDRVVELDKRANAYIAAGNDKENPLAKDEIKNDKPWFSKLADSYKRTSELVQKKVNEK